jgi:acetyl esterase/lipase
MDLVNLDPELAVAVPFLPALGMGEPEEARAALRQVLAELPRPPLPETLTIVDRTVPGVDGNEVPVRVYSPARDGAPVPALLYIHGGGFVVGDLDTEHAGAAAIAAGLGIVVVSVDYRLAPEHPFPAPLEDCYSALRWLADEAGTLGVDGQRVAVLGQSAGGGLAAGLALLARDRGGPALCFQLLAIPELDDRLDTPSMVAFTDTPMWNRPSAERSWRYYLGDAAGGATSPYAAPARADDLVGLPPAYVSTCEYDPLRDEGMVYALRLLQAGVSVELHQFAGTFHGSTLVPSAVSRRQQAEMVDALRRGLGLGVGVAEPAA